MPVKPSILQNLVERVKRERKEAQATFSQNPTGIQHAQNLSRQADRLLEEIFFIACTEVGVNPEDLCGDSGPHLAILATGGYGRQELAPQSDIDVTFVPSEEGDAVLDEVMRRMFLMIMEVFDRGAGLKVGYAYRLVEDCEGLDHTIQTALFDSRLVVGCRSLYLRFMEALMNSISPAVFAFLKDQERRTTWEKWGNTVYCSIPNLKESPGGLRDLQAARWIARIRFSLHPLSLWEELRGLRILTEEEVQNIQQAQEFMFRLRHTLHYLTQRPSDLLGADLHETLAERMGYHKEGKENIIALFRDYYHYASIIFHTYQTIADACLSGPLNLDRRLIVLNGKISATDPHLFFEDPNAVSRVFHHYREYNFTPSRELIALIQGFLKHGPEAVVSASCRQVLLSTLQSRKGVAKALRLMADLGILAKALPEFAPLRELTPLSMAHSFTVGEHTLRALETLEQLYTTEDPKQVELRRILEEVSRPEILYLAVLLHDSGKAAGKSNHSALGAHLVRSAAQRLGWDEEALRKVEFLVHHHLLMTNTARLRDLNQPKTLQDFVARLPDLDTLNMLYLLTYADIKATGPAVWTELQERFLEELYYRAEALLAHGESLPNRETQLASFRSRVRKELSLHNLPPDTVEKLCSQMSTTYLLNTPPNEIATHIRAIEQLETTGNPVILFSGTSGQAFTELTIVTYDDPQPGLLSKIAGVLFVNDVEVHAAQVFTRTTHPPIALDTLWVGYHGGALPPFKKQEVERDLIKVLTGQITVEELLQQRAKRPAPLGEPRRLEVRNDLSEGHTVVEIFLPDGRGLLYRLTKAMSSLGWDIHSARVNTLGGEARDAFYVTDRQGHKIEKGKEQLIQALWGSRSEIKV